MALLRAARSGTENFTNEVIRELDTPVKPAGTGIAVVKGSPAPTRAVITRSTASPELLTDPERARVWDRVEDYLPEADNIETDREADDIIVMRHAGPEGYLGMPGSPGWHCSKNCWRVG